MAAQPKLKIACIGAGYIGGSTMAIFAEKCPNTDIWVQDIDADKIAAWKSNELPIYEPDLLAIVQKQRDVVKNLHYTTSVQEAVTDAEIVFIAIGTPTKHAGTGAGKAANTGFFETATRSIANYLRDDAVIVEKSTVPIGVAHSISTILKAITSQKGKAIDYQIVSNPEFLSQGRAVQDIYHPNRILIGYNPDSGLQAANKVADLYRQWVPTEKVLLSNIWSSELSKLAVNTFLAQRISSINSIAAICEQTGADVSEIARAVGADSRVSPSFLNASVGFGGSHFQKDILNLVYISETLGLPEVANYFNQIILMNEFSKNRFTRDIVHTMFDTLSYKKIACLGFAYKANTGDTRASASIHVINSLIHEGAQVAVYDPQVSEQQMKWELKHQNKDTTDEILAKQFIFSHNATDACRDSHAIVILTEWPEFLSLDFQEIYNSMMKPAFVFDGRNMLDREKLRKIGFTTHAIGKTPDDLMG